MYIAFALFGIRSAGAQIGPAQAAVYFDFAQGTRDLACSGGELVVNFAIFYAL
jgi:hypothetical protein